MERSNSSLRWRTKKRSFGRGGGDTRRRKGERVAGRFGGGGFRGLGWVGQTDPDRVNSECTAASALRKISPPPLPLLSPPLTVCHPLLEVDNAISKYESARGMAKPVFTTQCFEGTWEGGRRAEGGEEKKGGGEKFPGCFLLFYPPPFFSVVFFFFRVLVVKILAAEIFAPFIFFLFFFPQMIVTEKSDLYGENLCFRFIIIVDRLWLLYRFV